MPLHTSQPAPDPNGLLRRYTDAIEAKLRAAFPAAAERLDASYRVTNDPDHPDTCWLEYLSVDPAIAARGWQKLEPGTRGAMEEARRTRILLALKQLQEQVTASPGVVRELSSHRVRR